MHVVCASRMTRAKYDVSLRFVRKMCATALVTIMSRETSAWDKKSVLLLTRVAMVLAAVGLCVLTQFACVVNMKEIAGRSAYALLRLSIDLRTERRGALRIRRGCGDSCPDGGGVG
jgi:hypothetical protein